MEPATVTQGGRRGFKDDPSRSGGAALEGRLSSRLRWAGRRLRGYILLEALTDLILFLAAAAATQLILDYGTRGLRWSIRAALLASILAGASWVIWNRLVAMLRVRIGASDIANLVERQHPQLRSLLISAVRFAQGELGPATCNAPALVASVIRRAGASAAELDFGSIFQPRRARRCLGMLIGVAALLVTSLAVNPELISLWFARNVLLQEIAWPQRTHLIVELRDGQLIGARGDDLVIQAYAQGVEPREVEFFFETNSGKRGRETMVTVGSAGAHRYRYTFKNAQEDFKFRLEGGDDVTETYPARLLERPAVRSAEVRIEPPSYSRLEPHVLPNGQRSAEMLPGSGVTIAVRTNKPVVRAAMMAGEEEVAEAAVTGDQLSVTVEIMETKVFHFALADEVGLENRQPVKFAMRVVKDDAPRVSMKVAGVGEMVTAQAIFPIELEAADTYGLARVELTMRVTGEDVRERQIPLPGFAPHGTTFSTSLQWPVAEERVVPGERLSLQLHAADFDDVLGPNLAQTPEFMFRIVTIDELLAELSRREQEFRMDFERLIDAQEGIRGGLLTLMGPTATGDSEELVATLTTLERRQRSVASSVNVVRQQVEQVLGELRLNQLADSAVEERLGQKIAEPLLPLVRRELAAAGDSIRQWSKDLTEDLASRLDAQQVAILSQMREILANMIQWEGYQEAVTMLRDILRLQQELRGETQQAFEKKASELFRE